MFKKVRVKDILSVDMRVSLFQTCINNAGGGSVKIKMDNAKKMYAIALEDVREFGGIEIGQLQEIAAIPNRRTPKKKAEKLLKAVYKKQNGKKEGKNNNKSNAKRNTKSWEK